MEEQVHQPGADGPLGPALAGAIADYNAALGRTAEAERALEDAQRSLAGARARLTALATGARITGAKALVVVPDGTSPDATSPGAQGRDPAPASPPDEAG